LICCKRIRVQELQYLSAPPVPSSSWKSPSVFRTVHPVLSPGPTFSLDPPRRYLQEPATNPPASTILLRSNYLPWMIKAVSSRPGEPVRVHDVISTLDATLSTFATRGEYERTLNRRRRQDVSRAFRSRTATQGSSFIEGICRKDFLEGRTVRGLSPGVDTKDTSSVDIIT
jgi:hypothetical protein